MDGLIWRLVQKNTTSHGKMTKTELASKLDFRFFQFYAPPRAHSLFLLLCSRPGTSGSGSLGGSWLGGCLPAWRVPSCHLGFGNRQRRRRGGAQRAGKMDDANAGFPSPAPGRTSIGSRCPIRPEHLAFQPQPHQHFRRAGGSLHRIGPKRKKIPLPVPCHPLRR